MRRFIVPIVVAIALVTTLILAGVGRSTPTSAAPASNAVPGQYIVTLKPGEKPRGVSNRLTTQASMNVRHVYEHALNGFSAKIPDSQLDKVRNDPAVLSVVEDRFVTTSADTHPLGVRRSEANRNALSQIGSQTNPINIDVAVIDTGIDSDHPDLNVVGGVNCVPGESSWEDQYGHGTHVAGIIGALDNGSGVVGVAPGARLWSVRVLNANGEGEFSDVICGVDWVTANADTIEVANMSLGGEGQVTGCSNGGFHQAVCESVAAGVTYVVASGNSGVNASGFVPAAFPEVITVSAIADTDGIPGGTGPSSIFYGADDTLASFSNYGSVVDIAAPGVNIQSTWLGGGYTLQSGTSMASPHVAAAAAIYLYQNPGASPAATKSHILGEAWSQSSPQGFTGDTDGFAEPLLNAGTIGGLEPLPPPPPPEAGCSLAPESGTVGSTTSLTCSGFQASEWVWLYWDSAAAGIRGLFIASGTGEGSANFTIPSAPVGQHQILAIGATSGIQESLPFEVEPSIEMLWSSGVPGSTLLSYVKGFGASEPVEFRWYTTAETFQVIATVTSNASGQATVFAAVPSSQGGIHTVEAVGTQSGATATGEFTVLPSLKLTPSTGKVGTTATATASGFSAGEAVEIRWAGTAIANGAADALGSTALQFTIPDAPNGANTVEAFGSSGSQASATYTVYPSATFSKSIGVVGTAIDGQFSGFAAGETIRIDWYETTYDYSTLLTVQASQLGTASVSFNAPESVNGYHRLQATGVTSGKYVIASFTIQAKIVLSESAGMRGDTVVATMTGHKGSSTINMKWYELPYLGEVIGSTTSSTLGSATYTFQIPENASYGDHKVESALTSGLGQANTLFSVQSGTGPVVATCDPSVDSGFVGASVTVECYGYQPGEFVRIYWDTTAAAQIAMIYATTGSGTATVYIPSTPGGEHTLIGVGATSGSESSAEFTVESSLKFNSTSGAVGSYAFATLKGFGANETVNIVWHNGSSSTSVYSATASSVGYATAFFAVPQFTGGSYTVEAEGQSSGFSASATFTITKSVKLTPTVGKVGSNLAVSVTGFDAGASVDVSWDGNVIGTLTTSSTGTGSFSTTVPQATEGSHTVSAVDGNGNSASAAFLVQPGMTLSSTFGPVGSEVTVTLTGFRAGETLRIEWWDTTTSYTIVTNLTASADGSGTYALTVPDTTYNFHKVQATGLQSAKTAFVNYTVQAKVSLSVSQGPVGTSVTVTLTGFKANEVISLRWYSNSYTSSEIASGSTNASGTATITFEVPEGATLGAHKVEGRSTSGYPTANTTFTVT